MSRTRGKDTLGPSGQRRGKRNRVVHVFTEDERTETSYIDIMKELIKERGLPVEVHIANASAPGSQRKPLDLVEAAVPLMRKLIREAERNRLREELRPQVWCLFDRDHHPEVDRAFRQAKQDKVRVAFSNPCFEVWRLLHHKDVNGTFNQMCNLVTDRLPFRNEVDNIKVVYADQILGRYKEAKRRALRMNSQHGDHLPLPKRDPYTDVFHFVEQGLGITSY
ncbi:RloB family protein [Thermopolyspora sp. NPDC052614]|uniref:RloB family protein n=1 Tax=Thermopolyspora sp. NPDC052614 TaxID=3155682 RepID=UPI0034227C03